MTIVIAACCPQELDGETLLLKILGTLLEGCRENKLEP